jgi:hypothetical protein
MTNPTTTSPMTLVPSLEAAWRDVDSSFERFCLTAGIGAIEQMLCEDAQWLADEFNKGRTFPHADSHVHINSVISALNPTPLGTFRRAG